MTALLVVDMQSAFLDPGGAMYLEAGRAILPAVASVTVFCREAGMLVVWTRMSHEYMQGGAYPQLFPQHFHADGSPKLRRGAPGFDVHPSLGQTPGDVYVDKFKYSAFAGTNLASILRQGGRDTVVVAGIATNVCCESTARDAFSRDFRVVMLKDATTTGNAEAHAATLRTIGLAFGYALSYAELRECLHAARPESEP